MLGLKSKTRNDKHHNVLEPLVEHGIQQESIVGTYNNVLVLIEGGHGCVESEEKTGKRKALTQRPELCVCVCECSRWASI